MNEKDMQKINEIAEEVKIEESDRLKALPPEQEISIEDWRNTLNSNFPGLTFPAEIGLSVVCQLLINDLRNPCALVLIDVPSSGKTITLNFFSRIEELIYTTDNFTHASFVSHVANKPRKDLERNDMLPQIRNKVLIIRDLGTLFAKKDENVQEVLGILTRVLDGEGLETNSGLHGKRSYKGDYLFMLLAASTPIRPKIWKVMGNLGSRLFFVNIGGKEKSEDELVEQIQGNHREKEYVCREVTANFLRTLWQKNPDGISWEKSSDDRNTQKIVVRLAKVLTKLRSAVNVYRGEHGIIEHTQAVTEMPDRLAQLLYNIARGHAVVCDRSHITPDDLNVVIRVALDSGVPNRAKIFKALIRNKGVMATNEVIEELGCSRPTALKNMQELTLLGLVIPSSNLEEETTGYFPGRPEQYITLASEYSWFLSEECRNLFLTEDKSINKPDLPL